MRFWPRLGPPQDSPAKRSCDLRSCPLERVQAESLGGVQREHLAATSGGRTDVRETAIIDANAIGTDTIAG